MGHHLRKVKSGDPLTVPAATFNAVIDTAEDFQRRRHDQGGPASSAAGRQAGLILVKNAAGADQPQCAVLGVGAPVFGPADNLDEFKNRLALVGVAPAASHIDGRFVVLLVTVIGAVHGAFCGVSVVAGRVCTPLPSGGFAPS